MTAGRWFDTHAHLSDAKFDSDRDAAVERAFAAGVERIVEIADGPSEYEKARLLAERHPGRLWWAAGLHPYYADQSSPAVWKSLEEAARHPQFVAIGEVGLDYAKCQIPHDVQQKTLVEAIRLAERVKKPLIIHCREAYADLLPLLKSHVETPQPGVIHCFSGTREDAAAVIAMGFYVGVDGPIGYPKSDALREAIASVPLDRIVLETDSPYLPPQANRGQRNEPAYLPRIGLSLSEVKKTSAANLADALLANSLSLFRLKSA